MLKNIVKTAALTGSFFALTAFPVFASQDNHPQDHPAPATEAVMVVQTNKTSISNHVEVVQNTGGNVISGVICAEAKIESGANTAEVKITNQAGGNQADVNPCNTCGTPEALVLSQPHHSPAPPTNTTVVMQANHTKIVNGVMVAQNTGMNQIKGGSKSPSTITTGTNTAKVKIKNMASFNQINLP